MRVQIRRQLTVLERLRFGESFAYFESAVCEWTNDCFEDRDRNVLHIAHIARVISWICSCHNHKVSKLFVLCHCKQSQHSNHSCEHARKVYICLIIENSYSSARRRKLEAEARRTHDATSWIDPARVAAWSSSSTSQSKRHLHINQNTTITTIVYTVVYYIMHLVSQLTHALI